MLQNYFLCYYLFMFTYTNLFETHFTKTKERDLHNTLTYNPDWPLTQGTDHNISFDVYLVGKGFIVNRYHLPLVFG